MKSLAIIPARGGSKRIPQKNIKEFYGKPIISYSIAAAIESGCFDEIMVSTDDPQIADMAISLGAKVPFMRLDKTSDDHATTADVLSEVLEEYKKTGQSFVNFCCIYPTAPFVTGAKLKEAYNKLVNDKVDSVIPITKFSYPVLRSFIVNERGRLSMKWPEYLNSRSQDLKSFFHDAGQFYFIRTESFINTKKILTENTVGIEVNESEVQDIDDEEDWKIAEIKYGLFKSRESGV